MRPIATIPVTDPRGWPSALAVALSLLIAAAPALGQLFGPKKDKDEETWTIRCATATGPDQMQRAERLAAALKQVKGLKPELVQTFRTEEGTSVYYGKYRRVYGSPTEVEQYKPDAKRDLELIRKLRLQDRDVWPFILATMDVLPTYQPGKPEWDLGKVDGYWSLHVAVFYNTETMSGRRTAAEEYCKILREQGEEAYFHHGPSNSSVYIGAFPKSAVQEVRSEDPLSGQVSTTLRIVDPRLAKAKEKFPHSLHNGHEMYEVIRDPRTQAVQQRLPTPSFLVKTPRARQLEQAQEQRRP